ncbi:MAG: tyrosine-type recombinase/integrase [Flavobacteriaceae bacterium]
MANTPYILIDRIYIDRISRIALNFRYHPKLIATIKQIPTATYLPSRRLWHVADKEHQVRMLSQELAPIARLIWRISNPGSPKTKKRAHATKASKNLELSPYLQNLLEEYRLDLKSQLRSRSTIHTYTNMMGAFLYHLKAQQVDQIQTSSAKDYIKKVLLPRQLATSTHRQFIAALKSFCLTYPEINIDFKQLPYPKKESKIPTVLSPEEIIDLIRSTRNLKHRAITAIIYASGLRVSELINLKLKHLDFDRRQVLIYGAKGNKDRQVMLAESFIPLFQNYFATFRPIRYFAEGKPGDRYSATSIRAFLKRNCKLAGITKRVTPHTLRHSYATHLMENGVDIRYIQELLGHARPETTMIYTHVSRRDLLSIKSPLDLAANRFLSPSSKNNNNHPNLLLSRNLYGTNETE